mmetsp:Transcript_30680/g.51662  ORF Transcript_30680/g.51662 Transcript_30680/m.51662 type:complete len:530 (+) Transcript_30680:245-1834(+)|eukprot:CAMPEP_0198230952 /NCGR_PEP_ID=MMETSP1445-20131203/114945_1 /TAXON_ID=36898 /ORGANISM="Pyramimonas sp., Strain CCMP2087" /LENGTH=529 /DNA_ID=CAMNT_0043911537 /DNA_START=181 /DNA_END=1770 /DNA_ORIENTATION=-
MFPYRQVVSGLAAVWVARSRLMFLIEKTTHLLNGNVAKGKNNFFLRDNHAPVADEVSVENLAVEGEIPVEISGVYARIGPNPQMPPIGNYHWFDGDGMVHSCLIKDGQVSYSNRWVRTARFEEERKAGWPVFLKIGDMTGISTLFLLLLQAVKTKLGLCKDGRGTANTAMVFHAGKFMALMEGDAPHVLRIACKGVMETVQRYTFGNKLTHSVTAHPKLDAATGEMHFFGYSLEKKPYVTYSVADKAGDIVKSVDIDLEVPVMMHDFALTENYVVFFVCPLVFDPKNLFKGKNVFQFERERGVKVALRRRDAPADSKALQWFDLPAFMMFHVATAWDEPGEGEDKGGGIVHLFGCAFEDFDLDSLGSDKPTAKPYLHHMVFNTSTGEASMEKISDTPVDFPQINPAVANKPCKYVYGSDFSDGDFVSGVAKFDLSVTGGEAMVQRLSYGKGRKGSEAIFVPCNNKTTEDDGFLITIVHDEELDQSEMLVLDAKTMSSTPLASVKLPQRVPYGFHASFVEEKLLQAQVSL